MSITTHIQPDKPFADCAGFTLLEVLIAVSILAITLVALYGSQSRSLSYSAESVFDTQAPLLASRKIAEIQAGAEDLSDGDGDFGDNYPGYTWQVEREEAFFEDSEILGELSSSLQKVTLSVRWSETGFTYSVIYYLPSGE